MLMSKSDLNKKILIDSDVIRHFIRGKRPDLLKIVFPGKLYILDLVEYEICRTKSLQQIVKALINDGTLKRMRFPSAKRFLKEYAILKSSFGTGEAACMAVARYDDDVIASNNLLDIKDYCEMHQIAYLTTIDILYLAYDKGEINESEFDEFLYWNLSGNRPSKIPFPTLKSYLKSQPKIIKALNKSA